MKTLVFTALCFVLIVPRDGKYSGKSQAHYTNEPYVGSVELEIKQGKIVMVNFEILDTLKKEVVNEKYAKYFSGNKLYIEQCKNDSKGIESYPKELLKKQDINKVDAISGATWSYNIFKASVKKALQANYK